MTGPGPLSEGLDWAGRTLGTPEGGGILVWLLAGVFLFSGAVKLRHPQRAAVALADFGVIRRVTWRPGAVLGAFELALGLALVAGFAAGGVLMPASVIATVVLVVFSTVLVRSLRRGDQFACFCFGSEAGLSRRDVARTSALACLALLLSATAPQITGQGLRAMVLEAVAALAVAAVLRLAAEVPTMLRLNSDPFGLADNLWVEGR